MTIENLVKNEDFAVVCKGGSKKFFDDVYCGDLLSVVMGKAQKNQLWITVMGNVNSIAVAVLCDISCIILSEGSHLDEQAKMRAIKEGIWVLKTKLPTFQTAIKVAKYL